MENMTVRTKSVRLCACLLNISEAHDRQLVERVASSALNINKHHKPTHAGQDLPIKSSVLNIFSDLDYNRSVITIVSEADSIGACLSDACRTAFNLIDLSKHRGGHPRLGSVDLVPIHPISGDISLEECGQIAQDIASEVTSATVGTCAFLFGTAVHGGRGLVARRKDVNWYQGQHGSSYDGIKQDVGTTPTPRYGLTGIGAIPYVTNCNVTIDTIDVAFGREIAASIRATTSGGLPGVQAMAFAHEGKVEIACNVQGICADHKQKLTEDDQKNLFCSFGKYYHVPANVIESRVREMASLKEVATVGTALVGFTPQEAQKLALYALSNGIEEYWKLRTAIHM